MGVGMSTTTFLLLTLIWIGLLSLAAGVIASESYRRQR